MTGDHATDRISTARVNLLVGLMLFGTLAGCAKPYDPFQVPKEDLRGRTTTIAMAPANVPQSMMSLTDTRASFEPIAAERLEAAGFKIVPSETWEDLWTQAATDVGGVYNASTGAADEERLNLVQDAVYRALEDEHQVHAVFYLTVDVDDYYNTGPEPYYCGSRGQVYFPTDGFGVSFLPLDVTLARAACLTGRLFDMEQRYLYGIWHALEVFETYADQTRAVRPEGERLKDPARIREALEAVVGPLADGAGIAAEQ
jgi:hypothetical protein